MAGGPPGSGLPQGPESEERRQLTVMFSDLVGSTELASSMDPEDWHEILDAYQHSVADAISAHGGVVTQFQGDGVIAYFGYPSAVETAGADSLAAGLAVVDAVAKLGSQRGLAARGTQLAARVGIHTGVAVLATARAGGLERRADIFGELPNLAARLQAAALPGQVLVSSSTASLAEGLFEFQPQPPLNLKGISRPVDAFVVVGRTGARSRLERAQLVDFLARTPEIRWLETHWAGLSSVGARKVLVLGEPGIGKSRLALEFAARIGGSGAPTFTAFCSRQDSLTPLQPFRALMGIAPEEPGPAVAWLLHISGGRPALFVLDDAHWADPTTLEVIDLLASSDSPFLIILTARPEFRSTAAFPATHRLRLERLDPAEARALVGRVPGGSDLEAGVVDALVARADGVPLYVEELTRSLATHPDPGTAVVPATLTEVITARLDRLGDTKRVAQIAAVIGREFDPLLLREVTGLDEGDVTRHLQRLMDQAIVDPPAGPEDGLWFRHALIHEAAYGSMLRPDRRSTHSLVADALLSGTHPDVQPQSVARHLGAAGRAPEAVNMWRRAAHGARGNCRFREAAGHEREILSLLPGLAEEDREVVELEARSRLAMSLVAADQGDRQAIAESLAAQELARNLGDDQALLNTYLILIPAWQAQADYAAIDSALSEATRLAESLEDPGYSASLRLLDAGIRIWQGRLEDALDHFAGAFAATGMPLDQPLSGPPELNAAAVVMRASVRSGAGLGCWLAGDPVTARTLADDAVRFASERQVPSAQGVAWATAAIMAQLDEDRARTRTLARAAATLPEEVATLQWRQWGAALRWWAGERPAGERPPQMPGPMLRSYFLALRADDPALDPTLAIRMLSEALESARSSGERFCEAEILCTRARTRARIGDSEGAERDLGEAADTARSQRAVCMEIKALTNRSHLLGDRSGLDRLALLLSEIESPGDSPLLNRARTELEVR